VRRFATEVAIGDIILLRTSTSTVHAVGLVASEYVYLPQFDDVNGWDLQHARRVRWAALPQPQRFDSKVFGANPPALTQVQMAEVVDFARRFVNSPPTHWQTAPLPVLPKPEPPLEEPPAVLRDLVAQVKDLVPLYRNERAFGQPPAEDELVAHFVIPLLKALGWRVERIGIQWRYVDVTLFERLPRSPENVRFIMEAKGLGAGVEGALEQGKGYLAQLGIQRDIVVTDGIRYRLYSATENFRPVAYANLERLRASSLGLFE
jgi:hypothetical protein